MSPAVPKIIQRFRTREVHRLLVANTPIQKRGNRPYPRSVDVSKLHLGIPLHNPFLPRPLFNRVPAPKGAPEAPQERKKWAQPKYSLRRQADLVKAARASGTLHLLPPGPKLSVVELQEAKREARRRAREVKTSQEGAEEKRNARMKSQSLAKPTVNLGRNREVAKTVASDATAPAAPTLASTPSSALTAESPSLSARPNRRRWVIRSSEMLAKRRGSVKAGYPGVVFRWTGKVPLKAREKGSFTVYAGRRRMFKGHKWERHLQKRRGQIAVRMRDMRKRIRRFKNVYKKRQAKPLSRAIPRKKESLPF
ncbi:hypothetical protein M0805_001338 [Coniferiporia weirii]|nr:hypothetical protein M0805_001338 [Coniferiporia weirii]